MSISFSVLIPSFNSESSIESAIYSCLNQTLKPCEIIVIDDCSADQTVQIVHDIKSRQECKIPIRLLSTSSNSGPAVTRNLGWNNAIGDYITFLDSDDQWHPNKLECIHAILYKNYDIQVLCHCNRKAITKTNLRQISMLSILIKNFVLTPNLIIKHDVEERFDENMRYAEDHDLILRLAESFPVYELIGAGIPTALGRAPMTAGGLSGNRSMMRIGELYMYKKFLMKDLTSFFYFPLVILVILMKLILEILRSFNK